MEQDRIYRGQIYYVYPQEVVGSEQEGGRPAVVVSNDVCNERSRVIEVVFLTTKSKPPLPTHVTIKSTNCVSTALCEQIESIDRSRIGRYINQVSEGEMINLEKVMLLSLQIATNLRGTKALEEWRKMLENCKCEDGEEEVEKKPEPIDAGCRELKEIDIESHPSYVRVMAERDVYKELYMGLLEIIKVAKN